MSIETFGGNGVETATERARDRAVQCDGKVVEGGFRSDSRGAQSRYVVLVGRVVSHRTIALDELLALCLHGPRLPGSTVGKLDDQSHRESAA